MNGSRNGKGKHLRLLGSSEHSHLMCLPGKYWLAAWPVAKTWCQRIVLLLPKGSYGHVVSSESTRWQQLITRISFPKINISENKKILFYAESKTYDMLCNVHIQLKIAPLRTLCYYNLEVLRLILSSGDTYLGSYDTLSLRDFMTGLKYCFSNTTGWERGRGSHFRKECPLLWFHWARECERKRDDDDDDL